ncbi:hypothetical protein OSB04_un001063 [Centaurea solstitialis]|uniref:Reverse transcriptase domain-containing protein n=1 Tax=Centaurea solstitialis TaxID=347529 RepID=A0AA38S3W4_9ASTR|nr:hypothetical protein OSB04_un001063 [Centaurea solstitialis]
MSHETDPSEYQSHGSPEHPGSENGNSDLGPPCQSGIPIATVTLILISPCPVASPARPFGPETRYGLRGRRTARKSVPLPTRMTFRIPTGGWGGTITGQGPWWVIVVLVVLIVRIPAALPTIVADRSSASTAARRRPPPDVRPPPLAQLLDTRTWLVPRWSGQPAVDQDSGSPQPHHGITPPPVYGGVFGGVPWWCSCFCGLFGGLGPRRNMPPRRENPDLTRLVSEQVMASLPGIVSQVAAGLNTNQNNNQGSRERDCTYKSFRSCNPKEFHGTEGAVGLLAWIESMESVLHISKCLERNKVEYAACLLQGEL